jgi:LysM repeat protein
MDIVKAVQEMDVPDNIKNMPSIIIYTVQHRDTLWKIAKKYATTIEDIIKMNELENPDNLESGIKILIPKKTFMK